MTPLEEALYFVNSPLVWGIKVTDAQNGQDMEIIRRQLEEKMSRMLSKVALIMYV